jgi:heme A synthase
MTLGLADPWVAAAYLLSIASALLCLLYGMVNWNRGDEPAREEDVLWAKEEKQDIESTL